MNIKPITESSNPVLAGSLAALRRAAKRAKNFARQTGTHLIVAVGKTTHRASKGSGKR